MSKQERKIVEPNLRFKRGDGLDFSLWSVKPLKEIAVRSTKKNSAGEVVRVLTNSAFGGVVDQRDYFEKDIANKDNLSGYFIVDKGAYVYNPRVSSLAPVGPISKNKIGKGVMSPLYTVFKFYDSDDSFFEYFFRSNYWHSYMRKVSNSGARHDRMNVTNNDFLNMPIPYPEKGERDKIADCFSSIDELIAAEERKLDELKAHKKGLIQQLFPSDGKAVPKLRFPEFHNQGEWKTKPLDKIAENLNSKRVPITEKDRIKGSIPYYGASGVIDYVKDYIFDDELLCISEDGANLVARTYPIAFSIKGKAWVNNHAHVLRFENACTQVIVENYLNSISLEDYLTGMAQPKLNRAKLNVIPIPLPDLNEQQKVADLLLSIDELIRPQIQKVNYLKFHRKGLIQNLFPSLEEVEI
ncbi:TPA: restriction endonuclease subunit S [Vibrio vulnificus]|nr:restriction endonuclease subunit S [Vibrio vulnificus]